MSVDQDEESVEAASIDSIALISVRLDREPRAFEKAEIRRYFEMRNKPEPHLSDPSFMGPKMKFRSTSPNAAVAIIEYLRTQAQNLAVRTEDRRAQAAEMLSELEKELQPPREKGDFRHVTD